MALEREWVTVDDPDQSSIKYTFDVSFLLSSYQCIYGAGCPGIRPEGEDPVVGCCVHGAYLTDPGEQRMIEKQLGRLSPETMQNHDAAVEDGIFETDEEGDTRTRTVDGACIFLNHEGFGAGEGCSLHLLALREDERPMDTKPTVCWQLPLHRDIVEQVGNDGETVEVHTIAAFERGTWGEGGAEFHWWCTEAPEAFTAQRPVYRTMEDELRAMVGDAVYDELSGYLDRRRRQSNRVRFLPVVET